DSILWSFCSSVSRSEYKVSESVSTLMFNCKVTSHRVSKDVDGFGNLVRTAVNDRGNEFHIVGLVSCAGVNMDGGENSGTVSVPEIPDKGQFASRSGGKIRKIYFFFSTCIY